MNFEDAKNEYSVFDVDVEKALKILENTAISINCWQGDDVGGFEKPDAVLSGGGIQATGNYPGKAHNIDELRTDFEKALSLDGGKHRINIHACYGDFGAKFVDRNEIETKHFQSWIDWANKLQIGVDFNGTFFSHPKINDGFSLASKNKEIREFWIEHAKRSRKIADYIGSQTGSPCVLNTWIPDGAKNLTVDKIGYRSVLKDSLDEIFKTKYSRSNMRDAVETKLFGIGSEEFVVGSHEFYMNYAIRNNIMLCIDLGHFNLAEDVSDKLSSILLFDDEVLLHVSRPLHWDSDHVVLFNDNIRKVSEELVRSGKLSASHIGLDFFDASINRIGAWAVGTRAMRKSLLFALLEPYPILVELEEKNKGFEKMALLERQATLPFGVVWEEYCKMTGVPNDDDMVKIIGQYEKDVLSKRG